MVRLNILEMQDLWKWRNHSDHEFLSSKMMIKKEIVANCICLQCTEIMMKKFWIKCYKTEIQETRNGCMRYVQVWLYTDHALILHLTPFDWLVLASVWQDVTLWPCCKNISSAIRSFIDLLIVNNLNNTVYQRPKSNYLPLAGLNNILRNLLPNWQSNHRINRILFERKLP